MDVKSEDRRDAIKVGANLNATEDSEMTEDLSAIYVSDETWTVEFRGVKFELREPSGEEAGKATFDAQKSGDLNQMEYAKALVKLCVVRPKNLQLAKLKFDVLFGLAREIEGKMGLTKMAEKNLVTALNPQ